MTLVLCFRKINENEVFTSHKIRLKKAAIKKLPVITIDEHLNFNKYIINVCNCARSKLHALLRMFSLLSYPQKKGVSNSFASGQFNYCSLIWIFSSIRFQRKISKLHKSSLRLCHNDHTSSYHEMLTKQGLVNIRIKNSQQLMIEIFQFIKGLSPVIMNEMFMLRNIQYIISNATDLDNQFPKTVYCGLKTIPYKGPQLWQQVLRK